MILANRLFSRKPPEKDCKSLFIFCEGKKREYQYFKFFQELDTRINVEIYKLQPNDDNSPNGLLRIAQRSIIAEDDNPNPKYEFIEGDEVWLVFDSDPDRDNSRTPQIQEIKDFCNQTIGWNIAESNVCFEVWLHFHISDQKPEISDTDTCDLMKQRVNASVAGGFDSRKHPLLIHDATENAKENHSEIDNRPELGCTQVFKLAEAILEFVGYEINRIKEEWLE